MSIGWIIRRQPQLLFIRNSSTGSAHAIICYKIDLNEKKMYIADPNFPGSANQTITYSNDKIGPYNSKDNVKAPDAIFDQIGYFQLTG